MSVIIKGNYIGNKRCKLLHESGSAFETSAPKDNNGDGSAFSPTDLLVASLGSCTMTVMAIFAERSGIDLTGMHMHAEKHMSTSPPRRISHIPITIYMPQKLSAEERNKLENVAHTCPVQKSLHPDVKVDLKFDYSVT